MELQYRMYTRAANKAVALIDNARYLWLLNDGSLGPS
jgi:hypothetical protein